MHIFMDVVYFLVYDWCWVFKFPSHKNISYRKCSFFILFFLLLSFLYRNKILRRGWKQRLPPCSVKYKLLPFQLSCCPDNLVAFTSGLQSSRISGCNCWIFLSTHAILSLIIFKTGISSFGRKNTAESEFLRIFFPSPRLAASKMVSKQRAK